MSCHQRQKEDRPSLKRPRSMRDSAANSFGLEKDGERQNHRSQAIRSQDQGLYRRTKASRGFPAEELDSIAAIGTLLLAKKAAIRPRHCFPKPEGRQSANSSVEFASAQKPKSQSMLQSTGALLWQF